MKAFGDKIVKSSTRNLFFAVFVCKDEDWEKAVHLKEQRKAIKGKNYNVFGRQGSGRSA